MRGFGFFRDAGNAGCYLILYNSIFRHLIGHLFNQFLSIGVELASLTGLDIPRILQVPMQR
jgi:hypothetical protein